MPTAFQGAENSAEHTFYVFCAAVCFSGLGKAKGLKFCTRVVYQCISNILKNDTIWSTQIELMDRAVQSYFRCYTPYELE
jgi:hypothetical protein